MRNELAKYYGQRMVFTATVGRFGNKPSFPSWRGSVPTVLLKQIQNTEGIEVADHLWVERGLQWEKLNIKAGDRVRFNARVSGYNKGPDENEFDYRLSYPTAITKVL